MDESRGSKLMVCFVVAMLLASSCVREQSDAPGVPSTSGAAPMHTPVVEPSPTHTAKASALPTPTATATAIPFPTLLPLSSLPTSPPLPTLTDQQREHNNREQEVINSLSTSVPIEDFREILGPELFYGAPRDYPDQGYDEYVFARPGYWVQAITDSSGTVVFYAVTSCDLDFRPIVYTAANPDRGIQLQVSSYKAVSPTPDDYHVFISGATANSFVFEIDHGEADGGFQDLAWGWNDTCPSWDGITPGLRECYENPDCEQQELDTWRASHAFNTVGVGDVDVAIDNFQIGVDRVQVRVYPGGLERAASLPPQPSPSLTWQEAEEERINSLSTLITIETFQRILGSHLFYRESDNGEYGEYSFARRGYWVQAVADRDGAVMMFAVTSCDEDFRPMVESTAYASGLVQLRVTTSEDLKHRSSPDLSDRDKVYLRGGNPSKYQQAYLGNNEICSPGANGSFNTVAVSWMIFDKIPSPFHLGVDGAWVGEHPDSQ